MGDLRNADDGQRALCNGPGHGDLGRPDAVLVCQLPQRCVQNRKLIQNGVVNGCALRTCGHWVPGIVLAGQRALFKHHVREEDDAVFPAVVQDARVFRRAVDQTVMVLHRRELQPVGLQNLVGLLDLGQIVVGDAKQRCVLLALEVPGKLLGPMRGIPHVVDPVEIKSVQIHEPKLQLDHVRHGCGLVARALGRELVRDQIAASGQTLQKACQYLLRGAHAIGIGGIPQVQTAVHCRVKNGLQRLGGQTAAEGAVVAPGPCAQSDFGKLVHCVDPLSFFVDIVSA